MFGDRIKLLIRRVGQFFNRQATILGYFFLGIIISGGLGVSIPFIIECMKNEPHDSRNTNQNLITYYIALFGSAALDLLLKLIDKETTNKKAKIIWLVISVVIFCLFTGVLLVKNIDPPNGLIWVALIMTIVTWVFWYVVHYNDEVFVPGASLGGNPRNDLSDG